MLGTKLSGQLQMASNTGEQNLDPTGWMERSQCSFLRGSDKTETVFVLLWVPQTQTLRQRFGWKWFIWEMIIGNTSRGVGRSDREGGKPRKGTTVSRLLLWATGTQSHWGPSEILFPKGREAGVFIQNAILHYWGFNSPTFLVFLCTSQACSWGLRAPSGWEKQEAVHLAMNRKGCRSPPG